MTERRAYQSPPRLSEWEQHFISKLINCDWNSLSGLRNDTRASQSWDPVPHYQHSEIGYNYRLGNVLAGIGRGQLQVLPQRVEARRRVFAFYEHALGDLPGINFMPEAPWGRSNRWLTAMTVDPAACGLNREDLRLALEAANIEARPVWKLMHLQPVFADFASVGGAVAEELFEQGLCLPSGSNLSENDLERIVSVILDTITMRAKL